ncbi:hypothetical protein C8R44DRAFT_893154 [Mycena epipterygia]|nr:hypothetical protein C8R44DRAFT_893154 [Mycena epipterygia]
MRFAVFASSASAQSFYSATIPLCQALASVARLTAPSPLARRSPKQCRLRENDLITEQTTLTTIALKVKAKRDVPEGRCLLGRCGSGCRRRRRRRAAKTAAASAKVVAGSSDERPGCG